MLSSSFFYETIQYFLIGFLLFHILIFRFCVSKSTVARSMVSDFCWICPLMQHWYEWLNVVLLHKDHLFPQLHSQHPSTNLLHFWVHKLPIHSRYKHWDRMDVFHCKRNKFVQIVFCSQCLNDFWLYWISGSTKMHLMEVTSGLLQLLCQTYRLHYPSSVYWLMSVFQKLDDNSRCNVAYKRFFFVSPISSWTCVYSYHWWLIGRTTLLHVFASFFSVVHPSSVKLDASFTLLSLLQIKHFPTIWFTDRNGF